MEKNNTVPRSDVLYRIARFAGTTMEWLVSGMTSDKKSSDNALIALFRSFISDVKNVESASERQANSEPSSIQENQEKFAAHPSN